MGVQVTELESSVCDNRLLKLLQFVNFHMYSNSTENKKTLQDPSLHEDVPARE